MYWRYNEVERKMDHDYPRDLSMWKGVPKPIDDAFQYFDSKYLAFKVVLRQYDTKVLRMCWKNAFFFIIKFIILTLLLILY